MTISQVLSSNGGIGIPERILIPILIPRRKTWIIAEVTDLSLAQVDILVYNVRRGVATSPRRIKNIVTKYLTSALQCFDPSTMPRGVADVVANASLCVIKTLPCVKNVDHSFTLLKAVQMSVSLGIETPFSKYEVSRLRCYLVGALANQMQAFVFKDLRTCSWYYIKRFITRRRAVLEMKRVSLDRNNSFASTRRGARMSNGTS